MKYDQNIEDARGIMTDVVDEYQSFFNKLLPTRTSNTPRAIGFTERNLTFYFCHRYMDYFCDTSGEIFTWQEMPFNEANRQHIDSILFHFGKDVGKGERRNVLYYIEAKRLYDDKHVEMLTKDDYKRIKNNFKNIPGFDDLENTDCYAVLLAGLELHTTKKGDDVSNAEQERLFKLYNENHFSIQEIAIDNSDLHLSSYYILYRIEKLQ